MTLKAVVEELMGGLRKLRIEREQEVEESVAAFKQSREELKKELEDFAARRLMSTTQPSSCRRCWTSKSRGL